MHEAAAEGKSVVYGDAAKREVLMAAGLMRAKALVITYNDKHSALKILHHVNQMRPDLPVVVRTADDTHIEEFKKGRRGRGGRGSDRRQRDAGVAGTAVSGVPLNRVIRRVQENRAGRYAAFSGYFRTVRTKRRMRGESLQPRISECTAQRRIPGSGQEIGRSRIGRSWAWR